MMFQWYKLALSENSEFYEFRLFTNVNPVITVIPSWHELTFLSLTPQLLGFRTVCDLMVPSESTEQKKKRKKPCQNLATKPDTPEGMLMLTDNSLQVLQTFWVNPMFNIILLVSPDTIILFVIINRWDQILHNYLTSSNFNVVYETLLTS